MRVFKRIMTFLFVLIIFSAIPVSLYARENAPSFYLDLAEKAIQNRDYDNAKKYFLQLKEIDSKNAKFYDLHIELIQKLKQDKAGGNIDFKNSSTTYTDIPSEKFQEPPRQIVPRTSLSTGPSVSSFSQIPDSVEAESQFLSKKITDQPEIQGIKNKRPVFVAPQPAINVFSQASAVRGKREPFRYIFKYLNWLILRDASGNNLNDVKRVAEEKEEYLKNQEIILEDAVAAGPRAELELKMNVPTILKSQSPIKRFLSLRPELLEVKRIDENSLELTSKTMASTLLHIWGEKQRWTLSVQGFSKSRLYREQYEKIKETQAVQYVEPFSVKYSMSGNASFTGEDLRHMRKQSAVRHIHSMEIRGGSPYGMIDTKSLFEQRGGLTWTMPYFTLGLTDGHIGALRNFSLRLFDSTMNLSRYTVSSKGIRGINYKQRFEDRPFGFDYYFGRERAGDLALDIDAGRNVFLQGLKLHYFSPSSNGRYSLNFANAFGEDHLEAEADVVTAFDFYKLVDALVLSGELGYDTRHFAANAAAQHTNKGRSYGFNVSEVQEGYKVLSGLATGEGQLALGAFTSSDHDAWSWGLQSKTSKDKGITASDSEEEQGKWNYDISGDLTNRFANGGVLRSSAGYDNQSSALTNRITIDAQSSYSRRFLLLTKMISHTITGQYQQTRSDNPNTQEFDRYSASTGFRVPVWKSLNWDISYFNSWRAVKNTGEKGESSRWGTSLGYYHRFNADLGGNFRIGYRDQIKTGSSSGSKDRLDLNMGLTYRPRPDLEFFATLGISKILTNAEANAYSATANWGMSAGWDTIISWNPEGILEGIVFKDVNSNKIMDYDEKGLPHIVVFVGDKKLETDEQGRYATYVKGRVVRVFVQKDRLPPGFQFTTDFLRNVEVVHHGIQTAHFGLNPNTGIYGVVFIDKNENNIFDRNEEALMNVQVTLDNAQNRYSDPNGEYQFQGVDPGEHMVRIQVNSIPQEYLPKGKVQQKVTLTEGQTAVYNVPVVEKK